MYAQRFDAASSSAMPSYLMGECSFTDAQKLIYNNHSHFYEKYSSVLMIDSFANRKLNEESAIFFMKDRNVPCNTLFYRESTANPGHTVKVIKKNDGSITQEEGTLFVQQYQIVFRGEAKIAFQDILNPVIGINRAVDGKYNTTRGMNFPFYLLTDSEFTQNFNSHCQYYLDGQRYEREALDPFALATRHYSYKG